MQAIRNPWREFLMNLPTMLMTNHSNPLLRVARSGSSTLMLFCVAFALTGCGKPLAKAPEKSLVRTAVVEPMNNVRSDGEASYLAAVKFDQETDLSFKVGGILIGIGPKSGTDWDEISLDT